MSNILHLTKVVYTNKCVNIEMWDSMYTYRAYSRHLLGATIAPNLVPWVLKKILSLEMGKNDIYLGGASKQNALLQKIYPKKCTHAPNV